jgi:hypothetical protein
LGEGTLLYSGQTLAERTNTGATDVIGILNFVNNFRPKENPLLSGELIVSFFRINERLTE